MRRFDLIVVGAGPSGLSAAIEAAKRGMDVVVFDENEKPGGQLFKQIHKFFGSKEHKAKIRGFKIGEDLLKEADAEGVKVLDNVSFTARSGEILGIAGIAGSGQRELLESIAGLCHPATGEILYNNPQTNTTENLRDKNPIQIRELGVRLSFVP